MDYSKLTRSDATSNSNRRLRNIPDKESFILEESPFMDLDKKMNQQDPMDWSQFQPNQMNSEPGSVFEPLQPDTVSAIYDPPVEDSIIMEDSPIHELVLGSTTRTLQTSQSIGRNSRRLKLMVR